MSKLVLARNWRKLDKPKRAEFVREFKTHLSRTYGTRLDNFSDIGVDVYGAQVEVRDDVSVKTRIVGGQFDGSEISYRLRNRKDAWKIIDVVIEGVSLVSNYRSQFATVLNGGDIDDLIAKLKKNPLKRALRLDKVTLAALEAVLALYDDPDRVVQRVPTLRLLTRKAGDIRALAERLRPAVARACPEFEVTVAACDSQIGSGARPMDRVPSAALRLAGRGSALKKLASRLRALPVPVIGRVQDGALWLDLRCLEDAEGFLAQLQC